MKKKIGLIILTLVTVIGILVVDRKLEKEQVIFVNEVRSWDSSTTRDGYFGSDYIELYNASDEDVSLEGWCISDDVADIPKHQLYDLTIGPKAYLVLYADGTGDSGNLLNFKINPAGEKIFLSDNQGNIVDSIYIPEQKFGGVYARTTDGAKDWAIKEESMGYSNNGAGILKFASLEEPFFSHESGFYKEEFTLTIKSELNCLIYYTLDGSKPTDDSLVYQDGILIKNFNQEKDTAVVVRAFAQNHKGAFSEIVTKTYFVGLPQYQKKNVASIVADPEDIFGDEGIFVEGKDYLEGKSDLQNFLQSGRAWEVKGNFEFFENGLIVSNQEIGIRTQGASTRYAAKKKMSIYSREEYSGNKYFTGLTLGDNPVHSMYTNHSISNIIFPELLKDRAVSIQHPISCDVFLNGEYWYSTYFLEKYNKYYMADTYQVNPDNVLIIKDDGVTDGPEDGYFYYSIVRGLANMSDMSVFEEYENFKTAVDIQSYIDYICANVYLCNMDVAEWKNAMCWRTLEDEGTVYGDGRMRWIMYDLDGFQIANPAYYGEEEIAAINSFTEIGEFTEQSIDQHWIYASCKNSPEFRKQFVLSFLDMANVNFFYQNVEAIFEKWNYTMDDYMVEFFKNRFRYIVSYMAEEFNLTGTLENVTLKIKEQKGGTIQLNTTQPDLSNGSWTGRYYTDYPITVTAVPEDGYQFIGWSGSVISDNDTIEAEVLPGGITLEAVFEKTAN